MWLYNSGSTSGICVCHTTGRKQVTSRGCTHPCVIVLYSINLATTRNIHNAIVEGNGRSVISAAEGILEDCRYLPNDFENHVSNTLGSQTE